MPTPERIPIDERTIQERNQKTLLLIGEAVDAVFPSKNNTAARIMLLVGNDLLDVMTRIENEHVGGYGDVTIFKTLLDWDERDRNAKIITGSEGEHPYVIEAMLDTLYKASVHFPSKISPGEGLINALQYTVGMLHYGVTSIEELQAKKVEEKARKS